MNRFVLKNTFIKVYIYHFFINIFYKNKRSMFWRPCHCPKRLLNPMRREYVGLSPLSIFALTVLPLSCFRKLETATVTWATQVWRWPAMVDGLHIPPNETWHGYVLHTVVLQCTCSRRTRGFPNYGDATARPRWVRWIGKKNTVSEFL
jgi:hypothetical protein